MILLCRRGYCSRCGRVLMNHSSIEFTQSRAQTRPHIALHNIAQHLEHHGKRRGKDFSKNMGIFDLLPLMKNLSPCHCTALPVFRNQPTIIYQSRPLTIRGEYSSLLDHMGDIEGLGYLHLYISQEVMSHFKNGSQKEGCSIPR